MKAELLACGLQHPEGPIVIDDDVFLVEECRGTIDRWSDGELTVHADLGGAPNGLAFDGRRIVVAQNGGVVGPWRSTRPVTPSIVGVDLVTGAVETLAVASDGVPLVAPNDVIVDRDGSIWFTDPGYFDDEANGRLCVITAGACTTEASVGAGYPNGLARVGDDLVWAETRRHRIMRDPVSPTVAVQLPDAALPDGMAVLPSGRLAVATVTSGGIHVCDLSTGGWEFVTWPGAGLITNLAATDGRCYVTDAGSWPAAMDDGRLWRIEGV